MPCNLLTILVVLTNLRALRYAVELHRLGQCVKNDSLTSQIPVEVMHPSNLALELVSHGFLQGLSFGR